MQLFARLALSHQAHLYFCYHLAINYSLKVLILTWRKPKENIHLFGMILNLENSFELIDISS